MTHTPDAALPASDGPDGGANASPTAGDGGLHGSVAGTSDAVLGAYRRSIDNIDAAIIHMLAERFRITQAVGEYKATHELPPADPSREERQVARLRGLAAESGLDPEFSEKFLRFVIDEVIHHHLQAASDAS
ncbi:chorismate mutase [Dermacoccus nishinomiyaensis]|uniref:chorismate mutase n=1 Tax=Dermacoccus TaxID=57495 RepID=UPI0009DE884C|nr:MULTISPECIES: chorismate mutase [Dermacoccus]MCT1605126.1 chorismate mutase [Dermacoccus nishinomiyaensis]PZP03041.1 MAG: chorismate mutase [Dermacoccus nishinomiyaensis]TCJ92580.1 chorismate mutase [Dermacoccus sp. SAI-028]TJZ96706.1 chorismate mutase [Dermacoccus nishinomiyaensis]